MALEQGGIPSASGLESLMRAAHSLKGAARIVGLDAAVRVAHALEDNFVAAQRGEFAIATGHVDVLLRAVDLLDEISQLPEADIVSWQESNEGRVVETVERLERLRAGSGGASTEAPPSVPDERSGGPTPVSISPARGAEPPLGPADRRSSAPPPGAELARSRVRSPIERPPAEPPRPRPPHPRRRRVAWSGCRPRAFRG